MDNQNYLPLFAQNAHHKEHVDELKKSNEYYREISESLRADVALAKKQAENAKKDALFSKIFSVISLIVAVASAVASFLPYVG